MVSKNKLSNIFHINDDNVNYEKIFDAKFEKLKVKNKNYLFINQKTIRKLAERAFFEISHYLRPSHLKKLQNILKDSDASDNDKYVAITLLKNANVAAGGILPMCQDTGTAIVLGKKGNCILTDGKDIDSLSNGILKCFKKNNLRFSQMSATSMYEEINTKNNLPAQIEIIMNEGKVMNISFTLLLKEEDQQIKLFFSRRHLHF